MPSLKDTTQIIHRAAQIGLQIARERMTNLKPTSASEVPRSAEALTPEWLTAVLCKDIPGARVLSVKPVDGSAGTSSRRRISLTYNQAGVDAGLPASMYTKSTAQWTQRMVLGLAGVIRGESGFFSQIRPHLKIEAPWGYHASCDPASWRSITMMEDIVATKGVSFCSPATDITRTRIEDLLANMAAWHGAMWNSSQFNGELSWLMTPARFRAKTSALIAMQKRSLIGAQRAERVIPPALFPRQQELWNAYGRSFELLSSGPQTLLHGDSHVGNTYMTRDGRMGYSDWQVVQRGGWAYDYAYILTTSLKVADRRAWEDELLRFYLDRLLAFGGPRLGFDAAWLQYRQSTLYPYFAWVFTIGAGALQPAMQPDSISIPIIERTSNAIEDLESTKVLQSKK
ncbi:MAG: hypothetical protein JWQ90_836 [Hydrocarboniphaga sp.]|uniref:aminoglycoside phosphotransferase family protein n=1 Tax=Hydrocarboniphaga sp. TaxID=2033016 RepID=UPI00263860E2|nr:aminoglycoside phosphotransferase family protein [Hydrocarboniphaga sp.]MDB5968386.1 hypothetical protein [Hydrocarboniphaga sp.]